MVSTSLKADLALKSTFSNLQGLMAQIGKPIEDMDVRKSNDKLKMDFKNRCEAIENDFDKYNRTMESQFNQKLSEAIK